MDRKFRSTIVVVLIFFGLLAFVFFFEKDKESKVDSEENTNTTQSIDVLDFVEEDIVRLKVRNSSGVYTVEKREDVWVLLEDEALDVNDLQVTQLIKDLQNLSASQSFESEVASDFGFDEIDYEVVATSATGEVYAVEFGDEALSDQEVYMRKQGTNQIYLVSVVAANEYQDITLDSYRREVREGAQDQSE